MQADDVGARNRSEFDDIITDGSHLENGKLKSGMTYRTGEHGYIYKTNENGMIILMAS